MPASAPHPFLLSAVIATYNVARYLPELLTSLERQTYGIENVQIVFVDDGSTDESGAILDAWAVGRGHHVTVIHQANQKVAAARNNGIAVVDADWVTFTDPDDVLQDRFFEEVAKFVGLYDDRDLAILATHQMRMDDDGNLTDTHFSSKRFYRGSRLVDLRHDPMIQMGAAPAFMRMSVIEEHGLRFDDRIRPTFEDAHFVGRYILLSGRHTLGLVASAKYHYRRRTDGTSLVQSGHASREKYLSVLEFGELGLLDFAAARGPIPRWLENTVLYDLIWYYRNERFIESPSAAAPPEVFDRFHELAAEVLSKIDPDAIVTFDVMPMDLVVRLSLLHGYAPRPYRADLATLVEVDEVRQLVHLAYWFNGPIPEERITTNSAVVQPVHETTEDFVFYGRTLMRRRHLWVARGATSQLTVDGSPMGFSMGEQPRLPETLSKRQLHPKIMRQRASLRDPLEIDRSTLSWGKQKVRKQLKAIRRSVSSAHLRDEFLSLRVRGKRVRDRFADAWVFMDRDTTANDNAEHLYRYVAEHHPEVNSWFVLRRTSPDWARLEADGFRLVEYGTETWKMLLLHAEHLASSHIDNYVVRPLNVRKYGQPRFRFTFLQHGVTKDDISRWLNSKRIDLFVTSTTEEQEAIAGPGPFKFSSREVRLTGMPRFDELLRRSAAERDGGRKLLVVAPTWRKYLAGQTVSAGNDRDRNEAFMATDYARAYLDLLRSPGLHRLAEETGTQVVFMPHPNIEPYLQDFDLPPAVSVLSYADANVQDVLARSAAFVTDYSSIAFDAAFIDVPVVYYQFDRAEFFAGMHIGRRGYFSYEADGFGPVVETSSEVERALRETADAGWAPEGRFADNARRVFVHRDGRNCERVFNAMRGLTSGVDVSFENPALVPEPEPMNDEVVEA